MERANHERLLRSLRCILAEEALRTVAVAPLPPGEVRPFTVAADRYRDPAWLVREAPAFQAPRIVSASAALARGGVLPIDLPGRSAIVVRDAAGTVRAFANSCRHRATRLVDAPCTAKALVCRYHGWTYNLAGSLIHMPHAEAFPGCEHRDLRPLPISERHGLIWLGDGVDAFIGPLDGDLAALALDQMTVWNSSQVTRQCNWKLIIEAFLESYHVRVLHRESIHRFFLDAVSVAEPAAAHIRAITARRALREAPADFSGLNLHDLGTPSYVIFPATVVLEHPDFVSLITLTPTAVDRTVVDHTMLVPAARAGEAEHWERSWTLIDGGVIQREDLAMCELVQRGLDDELLFGGLEASIRWFHDTLARWMSA